MDYNLCDIHTIQHLLRRHGFTFSKALGQNFIVDEDVCPQMAALLDADKTTGVLEIGPGIGVLTKELCRCAGKVCAVELDKRLFPVLEETLADCRNLTLIEDDILELDLPALLQAQFSDCTRIKVCANLPYYITSPVIMHLLESKLPLEEIVVMVQREAADRLCAAVGTREAGAVTVAVNYYGTAEKLFDVGRDCFMPPPKVDSAVLRIRLFETSPYTAEEEPFFKVVKAAFAQRRKTLLNALSAGLGMEKDTLKETCEACGLSPAVRAENLTMEDFVNLSNALNSR